MTEDDYLKTYKYEVVGKAISTDYIMQGIKGMSLQSEQVYIRLHI